jgi:hypothetical protein
MDDGGPGFDSARAIRDLTGLNLVRPQMLAHVRGVNYFCRSCGLRNRSYPTSSEFLLPVTSPGQTHDGTDGRS